MTNKELLKLLELNGRSDALLNTYKMTNNNEKYGHEIISTAFDESRQLRLRAADLDIAALKTLIENHKEEMPERLYRKYMVMLTIYSALNAEDRLEEYTSIQKLHRYVLRDLGIQEEEQSGNKKEDTLG